VPAHNVTPIADFRPTLTDVLTGLCTALSGRPTESNLKPMLEASTAARPDEGAYWWVSVTTTSLYQYNDACLRHVLYALPIYPVPIGLDPQR
jgi:hypothetical protein